MNDETLKRQLSADKVKLIEKYSLTCSEDMIWEFKHDKYHTVKYFSHKFAKKESVIALLFYIIIINLKIIFKSIVLVGFIVVYYSQAKGLFEFRMASF